jgi:tetraacyldisaccharide 4'-kinase
MRPGFLKWFWWPAAGCYGLVTKCRNFCYDHGIFKTVNLAVPVISIGNITAGGTGKTPFVIALGDYLQQKGWRIAVVTRGYKRKSKGQVVVSNGRQILASQAQAGDEPFLIANRLPRAVVIADADRVAAAQTAIIEFDCNLILADDAFQHRRLGRSLNIVLFDSRTNPKKEDLLPVGRLRESLHGMQRADYLVFSKTAKINAPHAQFFRQINPRLEFVTAPLLITGLTDLSGNKFQPESIRGKKILAFCGLGDNRQFEATVNLLQPAEMIFRGFPDHHKYSAADLRQLIAIAARFGCEYLIITEKDAVNLPRVESGLPKILVLAIALQIDEKIKAAVEFNRPLSEISPD